MLAGLVAPSVALAFGWRFAPATVAAIAAMLSIALQTVRGSWDAHREPGRRLIANPFGGLGLVWRSPTLRWLTHTCFWFAFVQLCLVGFLVTLLVEELGFGLREAGALLSVAQVSGLGGRVVWGWLADRLRDGGFVLAALGSLMLGASVLTVLLTIDWPGAAVQAVVIALGASAIGWNGVYIAEIARPLPTGRGRRGHRGVALRHLRRWARGAVGVRRRPRPHRQLHGNVLAAGGGLPRRRGLGGHGTGCRAP